jgi:hypothetical protein
MSWASRMVIFPGVNATINRKTQNAEPEIGTDRSRQIRESLRVDGYGCGLGQQRGSGLGFWTGLGPNRIVFVVHTWTTGRLPGPVADTIYELRIV